MESYRDESNRCGEYITFRIARQDFAMRTSQLRGILLTHEITPIDDPQFPDLGMIRGVARLHGRDFPVIDLRFKLGFPSRLRARQQYVIVVELSAEAGVVGKSKLLGFLSDRISDVVKLRDRDFQNGSVRVNGRLRRVLDPDSILSEERVAGARMPLSSSFEV